MYKENYLYIPSEFNVNMGSQTISGQYYRFIKLSESTNYLKLPIKNQNQFSVNDKFEYSDVSIKLLINSDSMDRYNFMLTLSDDNPGMDLFELFYSGGNRLVVFVDGDNIPRTPFISSAKRVLTTDFYDISLSLKPFNCFKLASGGTTISDYFSYKVAYNGEDIQFDPPYSLLLDQRCIL